MSRPCSAIPDKILGPGQRDRIDRVTASCPHLADDRFGAENLHRWLEG